MASLEQLRILCVVAECGNFTQAAIRLGTTQPTVSRAIAELERAWGGTLFDRTGRGVTLSDLGREAIPRARDVLSASDRMTDDLLGFNHGPRGMVSLGIPHSLVQAFVPDLFRTLSRERPGIRLRIFEGFSDQIVRWLAEGAIDIGIHSQYFEVKGAARNAANAGFVLTGSATQGRLPERIAFADLAKFPLVLPVVNNSLRSLFDQMVRRKGLKLNVVAEADSLTAQRALVIGGGCYVVRWWQSMRSPEADGDLTSALITHPGIGRRIVVDAGSKSLGRAGRDVLARVTGMAERLAHAK